MKKHLLKFLLTFFIALFISVGWVNAQTLIISEVTDPGDNANARFIELYNATDAEIDLTSPQIYFCRQANGTTQNSVALTGTIASGATFIIATNADNFLAAYGFSADFISGYVSGNGDDGYFLYTGGDHTTGTLFDAYGVVNEDGTGKDWEYLDTRAVRNSNIGTNNTTWTSTEWSIDASANAADCTPGVHTCDFPVVADTDPPVAIWDPADTETGVAIDKVITITFDEAIRDIATDADFDNTTVDALITNFQIVAGAAVTFDATIDVTNQIISITPDADLATNTEYTITLAAVEDASDNATAGETINFTTVDPSAPVISDVAITEPSPYYAGDNVTVTWTSANVDFVKIEAWVPSSTSWEEMIASTDATDGSELVSIPTDASYSSAYKVRVSYVTDAGVNAESAEFTVIAVTTDLLDLHSMLANDIVKYTGTATVTYARTSRNQKYIQDATGAVLIDDNSGFISGTYAIGDGIKNVEGKIVLYNGLVQLAPLAATGEAATAVVTITPEVRAFGSLTTADQSKLVKITNYTFDPAGIQYLASNLFVSSKNYDITGLAIADFAYRTAFFEADYIGQTIPITPITTVALVGVYNTTVQITARNLADFQSAVAEVTSTEYTVGASTITDVPFSTTLAVFEANITPATGATFEVFEADGTTPATDLASDYKLIVTAEDGITEATYTITKNAVLTDATVTSTEYTVGATTITDVPNGTDLATFVSNITPPAYGSFAVFEADGTTPATDLATGYILTATAEDGITTKDYTIEVSSVVADTDSEVAAPTTQVAAATVAVVDGDETAEAFEVFAFDINDAGTADGLPTKVSKIVLFYGPNMTIDLDTEISEGWFEVDGTPVAFTGDPVAGAESIAFTFDPGVIDVPDGGSVEVVLKLVVEPNTADGKVFQAMIDADQHGFQTTGISSEFPATLTGGDIVGNDITIDVLATELNFSVEPSNVFIDAMITPAVVVEAMDANGNIDMDYVTDVTITATGATLVGTPVAGTPVAGVATFDALSFSDEGTGVTLTAASGALTNGTSATFNVKVVPVEAAYYEGFDYTDGSVLQTQTGWTPLNTGDDLLISTGNLSYSGLKVPAGNKVTFAGGGIDTYFTIDSVKSGPVFASFIFKVTDQSAITDLTDGGYFAALADGTTSYDARIWVRPNPDAASGTFDIGFGNVSSTPPTTSGTYNVGDEIFAVISYNIDNGEVSAWINPSSSDFGGTEPTATLTSTDATPATSISKFFIRQDSDDETPFMEFDELRIGTTWAEVTPAASTDPETIVSETSLPDFGSIVLNTVGATEASFTVSGYNLTNDIVITAPAGFEISIVSGAGFTNTNPITLTPESGSVNTTDIYVKFHPTVEQVYSDNITVTSVGVTPNKTVAVSGTGVLTDTDAPVFAATYPKSSDIGIYGFDVLVNINEPGKVWFVNQAVGTTAPTSAEVKTNGTLINAVSANTEYSETIADLTENTEYDVYFVAEDNQATPNLSASPVMINVTTLAIPEVTIYDIQNTVDPSGDSPYVGELVKTTGIVTAIAGNNFWLQDGDGAWNGILAYSSSTASAISVGDEIEIAADVIEYYGVTELSNVIDYQILSSDNTLPSATVISTNTAIAEEHESTLINIANLVVTEVGGTNGILYTASNGTATIKVDDYIYEQTGMFVDDIFTITGIAYYSFSEFRLSPLSADDINAAPEISNITIDPTTPSSTVDVTVSATITDGTAAADLTVGLFYGSAEGSEDTEVSGFAYTGSDDIFEGTIPASTSTVLYYKINASDGSASRSATGSYSITVGIDNPDGIVSMNIFPNPSNGLFTIEMNASKAGNFNVEIINIQGQVVYTKQINQDGFYKDQIDISKEARGIYYIRINDGMNMQVSKIMIQ